MSFLTKISRGKQVGPVRLVVFGQPGTGKSTFAAGAPAPVFLDCERRTNHLDVARMTPTSWNEVLAVLRELYTSPGEFKTLVIDTLDHLELLIHKHVCEVNGWANIEEPSYGRGYVPALAEWGRFMAGVEALHSKGLNVIMLAHSQLRTVQNPAGPNYDMYALKLKGGQKTCASDLIREKADLVGFARFDDLTKKADKADPKAKALTTGERMLTFAHHPAFESTRGIPMADEVKLSWDAFDAALKEHNK